MKIIVHPVKNLSAKICIIGEALGEEEQEQKRYFVGRTGKTVLNPCLTEAGISREEILILNVIREKPVRNDITNFVNVNTRKETRDYIRYKSMLVNDIKEHKNIKVILAMGRVPIYALTYENRPINELRGNVFQLKLGGREIPIICCNHPTAALRGGMTFPGLSSYGIRSLIVTYLKKCKYLASLDNHEIKSLLSSDIKICPDVDLAIDFIKYIREKKLPFTFDIETKNEQISFISLCPESSIAMSIPFYFNKKHFYKMEDEDRIWKELSFLFNSDIPRGAHNAIFDIHFLLKKMNIHQGGMTICTMVGMQIARPDYSKSLECLSSTYNYLPPFKYLGGERHMGGDKSLKEYSRYSALDSLSCYQSVRGLESELKKQNNWYLYLSICKEIPNCVKSQVNGIKIDVKKREEFILSAKNSLEEIHKFDWPVDNINSTEKWIDFFYKKKKYHTYLSEGKPTINREALTRIIRAARAKNDNEGEEIARNLHRYRDIKSQLSQLEYPLKDGRLYYNIDVCNWKTRDLDIQNAHKQFKKCMIADDGYQLVCISLIDPWVYTYAFSFGEKKMAEMLSNNEDIFSLVASIVYDISSKSLLSSDDGKIFTRQILHNSHYIFSLDNALPLKKSEEIFSKLMEVFPDIPSIWNIIESRIEIYRSMINVFGNIRPFMDRTKNNRKVVDMGLDWFLSSSSYLTIIDRGSIIDQIMPKAKVIIKNEKQIYLMIPKKENYKEQIEIVKQSFLKEITPPKLFKKSSQLPNFQFRCEVFYPESLSSLNNM